MSDTNMLMDVKTVAKLFGVQVGTIYSWIHYKQIPDNIYRKLGRKPIFIRDEVMKWFLAGATITKRKLKNH